MTTSKMIQYTIQEKHEGRWGLPFSWTCTGYVYFDSQRAAEGYVRHMTHWLGKAPENLRVVPQKER